MREPRTAPRDPRGVPAPSSRRRNLLLFSLRAKLFASLMEQARKRGWSLAALDLGVDTSTPSGEMIASVLATFAQFEPRLIGQRTRDARAVKRAQGVRLGRPREMDEETVERIEERRTPREALRD